MALCSLCLGLPFTGFPSISHSFLHRYTDDTEFIVAHFDSDESGEGVPLPDPIGFPYHENIGVLAESAKTCPLCAVVQAGVQEWLVSWNNASGTKKSIKSRYFLGALPLEERLWLTEISPENQGFCVWTMNPWSRSQRNYSFYLLTLVGLSVEERTFIPPISMTTSTTASCLAHDMLCPDSPLKNRFRVRPMDPDSGSSRSLHRAASWAQNCIDNHPECSDGSDVLLPSRILDIEAFEGDTISLVNGSSIPGNSGKYACLSYCWGHSLPYTTTRATIQARRSGIYLNETPQTFIDAVTITRRLGLRYLWIDSLCICQDDPEDWARQSGLMADVYSNAYVVIAANRSSDCTGGCFHTRAPRAKALLHIPIMGSTEYIHATRLFPSDHSGIPGESFSTEPLSERGWALQERTMAQRTLHYNDRQMYFECIHGIEAEDGYCEAFSGNYYQRRQLKSPKDSLDVWYILIGKFGQRKLSRGTDKLPAMSGWAKRLQKGIQADYVAGLWSNSLLRGMAWECDESRKPASLEEYTGPSWSWASYGGSARSSKLYDWEIAEVLGWHVELKEEANPFGEVRDAWIRIRGPVTSLKPSRSESFWAENELRSEKYSRPRVTISGTEVVDSAFLELDNQSCEASGEWRKWDLQAMLLCGNNGQKINVMFGLVFKGSVRSVQHGKMERVGSIKLYGDKAHQIIADANWKTITLV